MKMLHIIDITNTTDRLHQMDTYDYRNGIIEKMI